MGTFTVGFFECMCAKLLQSCLTLCNLKDCSLPGSSVCGILQARILEGLPCPTPGDLPDSGIVPTSLMSHALAGGFFPTSATWEACRLLCAQLSHFQLFATPQTVACQSPLTMEFSLWLPKYVSLFPLHPEKGESSLKDEDWYCLP